MTLSDKSTRVSALLTLLLVAIASYVLGAYGASTGHAQADGQGRIDTYHLQVMYDTNKKVTQAFLADTRTGEVYIAREVKPEVSARWVSYISFKPKN